MKRKNVKVALERVARTDLMCMACGSFKTEWAVVPGIADLEPQVGIHTKCLDVIAVRFKRGPKVSEVS